MDKRSLRARPPDEPLLPIAAVAARWSMHYETIRRWCAKGALRYTRVGPHGAIRIPLAEIRRHETTAA